MNFIGTSCETLRLSTFGSSCEKLAVAQPLSNGPPKSENEAVANTLPKGSGNNVFINKPRGRASNSVFSKQLACRRAITDKQANETKTKRTKAMITSEVGRANEAGVVYKRIIGLRRSERSNDYFRGRSS